MWKFYSLPYLKHNRATAVFIAFSSFLTSLLLSFFLTFFHNLWMDRLYQLSGTEKPAVTPLILLYSFLLSVACLGLILMLYSAFSITMNNRLHQLGVLQSAGATPRQIRSVLISETILLAPLPAVAGIAVGAGAGWLLWRFLIDYGASFRDEDYRIAFSYHPLLFASCLAASLLTMAISTWIPARRLSRIPPLDAIRWGGEPPVFKMRRFRLLSALFGIWGELAQKSIYARRKAFRASTISLFLSFLAFVTFLNLQAMSAFSTQETYFDRYRGIWDFQIDLNPLPSIRAQSPGASAFDLSGEEIRQIDGVESCLVYRRFSASAVVTSGMLSPQVLALGPENLLVSASETGTGSWRVSVPLYVLDSASFAAYCEQEGISPGAEAIAFNRIWDRINSKIANRAYIPFLDPTKAYNLSLSGTSSEASGDSLGIRVDAFARTAPRWKEEPGQDVLTLIVSEDYYRAHASSLETGFPSGPQSYVIKTAQESENPQVEMRLHELLSARLPDSASWTLDSRLEEERSEPLKRRGFNLIMGILTALLSTAGLANIFSTTLGQVPQRRREFARYLSAGLSPKGLKRILFAEALILCLKPLFFSLLLNVPFVIFCMNYVGIPLSKYWEGFPLFPLLPFTAFVLFFTGLAYWLGAKKILEGDPMDALRDETML